MTNKTTLLLVDDHDIVREGLEALLALETDIQIVGTAASGAEALVAYQTLKPNVVLLDLRMPGMDGLDVLNALIKMDSKARVLMLSSHDGDEAIHRALGAGAAGYLLKKTRRAELAQAIRTAKDGPVKPTGEIAERIEQRSPFSALTARETEILAEVARSSKNREIAISLGISENTVKNHINTILLKLNAADRTEAVTIGLQRGIIDLGR